MSEKTPGESQEQSDIPVRPRQRFRPVIVISVSILIALIIASGVFTSHQLTRAGGLLGPTPTATLTPGSNQFYFSVSPSWGTITIDGHRLSPVPAPGMGKPPLMLSPGTHQVVWQIAPFPTVQCQISLPFRFSSQNCVNSNIPLTFPAVEGHPVSAYLLNFDVSLASLSSSQFDALYKVVQTTLNQLQGVTTMQAGEHFANSHFTSYDISTDTTTTPLQATLSFLQVDAGSAQGSFGSCTAGGLIDQPDTCSNQGQNCLLFCPVTEAGTSSVKRWDVFAEINMAWTYAPLNDPQQPVLLGQDDPAAGDNTFLVALSVQWNGSNWQVTFYHDNHVDSSPLANPACDAAQFVIGEDPRFLSVAGSTQTISLKFVSGANPAAGCVAEAFAETTAGTLSLHPLASCLYRLGVPLALNSEAHRSWPFLLQASPYEQSIAQQIVAQAHTA
ncbi:MAG: hypothetical protein ACYDER_21740 [Ktedonobacteraceae bacterium]